MEHTLHLAAKDFIETTCPTPSRYKKKKSAAAAKASSTTKKGGVVIEEIDEEEAAEDEETIEADHEWLEALADTVDGQEVDEAVDFEPGDVFGKILALINQVGLPLSSGVPTHARHSG